MSRGRKDAGRRSDDDRQRARLEREQRRAQREGRPVPHSLDEVPVEDPSLLADDPALPSFVPSAADDIPEPAIPDPVVAPAPGPADPFASDPYPVDPAADAAEPLVPSGPESAPWWSQATSDLPAIDVADALAPPSPDAGPTADRSPTVPPTSREDASVPAAVAPSPALVGGPDEDPDPFDHFDAPTAVASVPREPLAPLRPAAGGVGSTVPPATVQPRTAPARRGVSRIAAVLVLALIALIGFGAYKLFQPFHGDGGEPVSVKIPPGSSVDDIGALLVDKGVIDSSLLFSIRARTSGGAGDLKAGTVELKQDMSYADALTALRSAPLPDPVVRVGIPEGLSRRETAAHVKQAGVTGSYLSASARSPGFSPRKYGQPKKQSGLEGFLFPATYELPKGGATAKALVALQVKQFEDKIATVSMKRARRAKLSTYDVLIIASMIEREVSIPSERKLVAAVIYNRLKTGMTLGIDATIRYAERNWTEPLKVSELERDGPFNTRTRTGLPPTPIGNPGLASIKAAAAPANKPYLYYVVKPCGNGKHAFSSTDAGFAKDQQAYAVAQRKAGGDPSVCKDK